LLAHRSERVWGQNSGQRAGAGGAGVARVAGVTGVGQIKLKEGRNKGFLLFFYLARGREANQKYAKHLQ